MKAKLELIILTYVNMNIHVIVYMNAYRCRQRGALAAGGSSGELIGRERGGD